MTPYLKVVSLIFKRFIKKRKDICKESGGNTQMIYKKIMYFAILMLPLTPFTKELGAIQIKNFWVDSISHTFFVLAFVILFYYRKLYMSRNELIIFSTILLISLVNSIIFELSILIIFKQFLPLFILYFVSKAIITYKGPEYIFERYIDYAVFAALFGFFQFILKIFGIKLLTVDLQLTLDSFAFEPSHYVVMTLPALVYLYEKRIFNLKFFIILIALILTFKSTLITSILVYLMLTNIRFSLKSNTYMLLGMVLFGVMIYIIPGALQRHALYFFNFLVTFDINGLLNLTVYSFMANFHVAVMNFISTYGLGVGLGGHDAMYYKDLILYVDSPFNNRFYGINSMSAHSLLIRIISELGIIGILLLIILFIKSLKIKEHNLRVIALASYSSFIAKFFKTGSYFEYGSILFLVLIIISIKLDSKNAT